MPREWLGALLAAASGVMALAAPATAQCQPPQVTEFDGADGESFGNSVATSGATAVMGVVRPGLSGAAVVFVRAGDTWVQQAVLTTEDGDPEDGFGRWVAISGDSIVIGAPFYGSGAAYVFVRSGSQWTQQAKLEPGDATDVFGRSVAIDGDTVLVGAHGDGDEGIDAGAAYVFTRLNGGWFQQAKLTASDAQIEGAFGLSVALSGDTAVIGAVVHDQHRGAAYVFVRSGNEWPEEAKLVADDRAIADQFGWSVDISGDTVLVGSIGDDDAGPASGSAYFFGRSEGTWTQSAKVIASDGVTGDRLGMRVALSGELAVVGAPYSDNAGPSSGSTYVFARNNEQHWVEQAKLVASDAGPDAEFGIESALWGTRLLIGAPEGGDDHAGRVYEFNLACLQRCPMDLDDSGALDLDDFVLFIVLFDSADPDADCDASGHFDLFDYLCFVTAFNGGCE
jgi:hypothetical protein